MQAWSIYNGRHYNGNEHVKQKTENKNENSHEIKYDLHSFHNVWLWLVNYKAKHQLSLTLLLKVMQVLIYIAYTRVLMYL